MPDKFFLSASGPEVAGSLHAAGERVLWRGQCAVAEYAFDEPASLPRWTLPEETEVVITDQRVLYRDPATMGTGELHWRWPQHLRVQPGNRETGRLATVTQIQLVCSGPSETFPALVFAGGDVTTVSEADRLANVLRQAIARYRVEHAEDVGLTAPEARMLSRLVIGPEFSNYQGGDGQTVSLLGAQQVQRQAVNQPTVEVNLYAPRAHAPAPASTPPYSAPASTPPYSAPASTPPYSAPASTPPYSAPASTPPYTAPIAYPAAAAHAAAASPYAEAAPHPSLYSHVVDQPSAGYAPPSAAAAPSSGAPLPPPPRAAYPGGPSPSSAAPYPAGSAPSHAGPSPSSAAPYPTPSSAAPHQATTAPSSSSATPHPTPSHTAFRGGPSPSSAAPYPTPSCAPPSHAASHGEPTPSSPAPSHPASHGEPTPSSPAPYSTPSHAAFRGGPSPSSAAPYPTSPSASPYSYPYPSSPAPFAEEPAGPLPGHTMRRPSERRGREPEQPRPWETQADLESRAADLAARVAMLVSGGTDLRRPDDPHDTETTNLSAYLGRPGEEPPPGHHGAGGEWDGRSRAEAVRRTATRLAGNAARDRNTTPHRTDDEIGAPTGGNHRR